MKDPHVVSNVKFGFETFGIVRNIGESIAFIYSASCFISGNAGVGWSLLLSLNWIIGNVFFWLILGPIIPFLGFLAVILGPVAEWTVSAPPDCEVGDFLCDGARIVYEQKIQKLRSDRTFSIWHWGALAALVIVGLTATWAKKHKRFEKAPIILYGLLFSGLGAGVAYTHPPSENISDDLLVRFVGFVCMIFMTYHAGILLTRAVRYLKGILSSTDA